MGGRRKRRHVVHYVQGHRQSHGRHHDRGIRATRRQAPRSRRRIVDADRARQQPAGRGDALAHPSAASSAVLTLPTATGTLIGTGDSGTLPVAAIDIDGATDIGADLTTSDLIVVDDGAGGTNRKAALSRVVTLMTNQGFTTDDPTALAIALG